MNIIKKIFKIPICQILYTSGLLHCYLKYFYMRRKNFPVVIVYYHSFTRDPADQLDTRPALIHRMEDFVHSLDFIKRYFQVASLDQVVETLKQGQTFPRPTVVLTVDDGYENNYDILFPMLKKEALPATIFLTTDLIGTNRRIWSDTLAEVIRETDRPEIHLSGLFPIENFSLRTPAQKRESYIRISERLKDLPSKERESYLRYVEQQLDTATGEKQPVMLNWDQVREMHAAGITFGAHTATHPILTRLSVEEARDEIARSKQTIEQQLGEPTRHFAVPNGRREDFNRVLEEDCRKMGFESISTTQFGCNENPRDRWGLKRIGYDLPLSLFAINLTRAFLRGQGK